MIRSYFKIRGRFDFSPHRFEIGNPLIQSRHFSYNHLFKKVYGLSVADYPLFYQYHLDYYLQSNARQEQEFFAHFYRITAERIAYYKMQDPFSSKQQIYQSNIAQLESFQSFLHSIDQWHVHQPLESVITEKDQLISSLKARVVFLEEENKQLKEFETSKKIQIRENYLPTFLDLIKQMQELELPDGNKLLTSSSQSGWYKMIAKYFLHGSNEIPINTARNYFPAQKDKTLIKGTDIYSSQKLFKINHLKRNG